MIIKVRLNTIENYMGAVEAALLGTKVNSMASRVKGLVCLWHHEHGRTYTVRGKMIPGKMIPEK